MPDEYTKRRLALLALLKKKGKNKADLMRVAGMIEPSKYVWGLQVLRGPNRGEPTLAKLEAAAAKL